MHSTWDVPLFYCFMALQRRQLHATMHGWGIGGSSHPEPVSICCHCTSIAMAMHCWRAYRNFSGTLQRQRSARVEVEFSNMNSKKDCWEFIKIYQKVILNVCRLTSIAKHKQTKSMQQKPPSARPKAYILCFCCCCCFCFYVFIHFVFYSIFVVRFLFLLQV